MTSGAETTHRGRASQFVQLLRAMGVAATLGGCVESMGDIDASGTVDSGDLAAVLNAWG